MLETAINKLMGRMVDADTLVCCGLDPDPSKLSAVYGKGVHDKSTVFDFLVDIVDVVSPYVCAFKAQKAFFDLWDDGHNLLRDIVAYVHHSQPSIPVFVDCKVGDIENTMRAYALGVFSESDVNADGIVVNPYMGDDVFEPLREFPDKAIIVLVQTSNPRARKIQDLRLAGGKKLWEQVLDFAVNDWNSGGNIIPVLASTSSGGHSRARLCIPDTMPVLLAGVGAQGGSFENIRPLLNSAGVGVFVNSSRGIIFAGRGENWRADARKAACELRDRLNIVRYKS